MEIKYPFFQACSKPITDVFDHFKFFIKLALSTSFLLTLLSFLLAQNFLFVAFFLKLLIVCVFLKTWYDGVYLQKQISLSYFKENIVPFFKFFGVFLLFLLINALPVLSLYLLLSRKPNPFWVFELCYFTFVSIGFIIPFVLMRFYTNIAFFIEGIPFLNLKQTFQNTSFKTSKIVFSFTIVLLFCFVLFLVVSSYLRSYPFAPLWAYHIFSEFLFSFTLVLVCSFLINFIRTQKQIFK